MIVDVRNWVGLLMGATVFLHEAITTKNIFVMTAAGTLMGIPLAFAKPKLA